LSVACRRGGAAADEHGIALVGADGLWSGLRARLGQPAPEFRQRTAWRALVPADSVEHVDKAFTVRSDATKRMSWKEACAKLHKDFTTKNNTAADQAYADITFGGSWSHTLGDEKVWANYYGPGHTGGDAVIFFTGANVVHMGDDFFSGMFPFVDLDSGGDVDGYVRNVGDVITKLPANVKIIPGHGPLSTIDDLKSFHHMLVETTGIVRKKMAEGKKVEQIKAEGFPSEWKSWGSGFVNSDRWIDTIYRSLSSHSGPAKP
jgi:glyoxylase-like metal-dependent hydrolase (beta-lactamase superfamily II)